MADEMEDTMKSLHLLVLQSQLPHKIVNLLFIPVIVENKLTSLWGSWLSKTHDKYILWVQSWNLNPKRWQEPGAGKRVKEDMADEIQDTMKNLQNNLIAHKVFFKVVLQKSIPTQIRQLILHTSIV